MAAIKECASLKIIGEWSKTNPKNVCYAAGICAKEFVKFLYKNNYIIASKERRSDFYD